MVSILDSQLEGCGFESSPILDGNGAKAMPGSMLKPCQDQFLHPIMVHSIIEKERKYRQPNGAHQKIYLYKIF